MSDSPVFDAADATGPAIVCHKCHLGRGASIVRAVLYTPIILAAGALAAVAMFPGLAEYASPLIGPTSGASQSCAGSTAMSCSSVTADPSEGCSASMISASGCCSKGVNSVSSAAWLQVAGESCPASSQASSEFLTVDNELPADALILSTP